MSKVRIALAAAAMLAFAGEASARQSGYVYLECDLRMDGSPGQQAYRIGGGQWAFMANPDWEAIEWVDCGGQRQRGAALYVRTCTFNDQVFKSEIRVTTPGLPWEAGIFHEVNRYSGAMAFSMLTTNGIGNRTASGSCRAVAEPKPERKF